MVKTTEVVWKLVGLGTAHGWAYLRLVMKFTANTFHSRRRFREWWEMGMTPVFGVMLGVIEYV